MEKNPEKTPNTKQKTKLKKIQPPPPKKKDIKTSITRFLRWQMPMQIVNHKAKVSITIHIDLTRGIYVAS